MWSRDLECHSGLAITTNLEKVDTLINDYYHDHYPLTRIMDSDVDNLHRICLQVYLCEGAASDYSVSCYVLDKLTGQWSKLFTTGVLRVGPDIINAYMIADPNMDKVLMLSLSQDERYTWLCHMSIKSYCYQVVHCHNPEWVQTLAPEWPQD